MGQMLWDITNGTKNHFELKRAPVIGAFWKNKSSETPYFRIVETVAYILRRLRFVFYKSSSLFIFSLTASLI